MKVKRILPVVWTCCLIFAVAGFCRADPQISESPAAYFPDKNYIFQSVVDGTVILHDYIVQNKGAATLLIQRVKTDWGCTAVSYTRQIPPGGEGKITIKVRTNRYGGKRLLKNITVTTNDRKNRQVRLAIAGYVEKFVNIAPRSVRLRGYVGRTIKAVVKIIPEKKYPFKIIGSGLINPMNIRFTLEEAKPPRGAGYILTVENLKKEKGRYYDMISLKTDSKIKPLIKINVYGQIMEPQPSNKSRSSWKKLR